MTAAEIGQKLKEAEDRVGPEASLWKADGQRDKAIEVIEALIQSTARPVDDLRVLQAAAASPGDPKARSRASVRFIADALHATLPTLVRGPDSVGVIRVVAEVAAELGVGGAEGILSGGRLRTVDRNPLRSLPPPEPLPEAEGYVIDSVDTLLTNASPVPALRAPHGPVSSEPINEVLKNTVYRAIEATAERAESGLTFCEGAIEILDIDRRRHYALLNQILATQPSRQLDALWWSQALYSPSAATEYRDIADDAPDTLVSHMATDLLAIVGHEPDPSASALFVETVRRLIPSLDERRPWGEWLARLLNKGLPHGPAAYAGIVREDATLLPVSAWLYDGEDPTRTAPLDAPVTGREVVRRYFRERQLAAWLTS